MLASHAWRIPGFMPSDSNQPAVPCDLAAAPDVVVAVGDHHDPDRDRRMNMPA